MKNARARGFTLVELMVVVAVIAILAAVAVPMYSTFRIKGRLSTVARSVSGVSHALQTWFEEHHEFTNINVITPQGGSLMANNVKVGTGLPAIEDMTWQVGGITQAGSVARIEILFDFTTTRCPDAVCDGKFCLECDSANDACNHAIVVGLANQYGLDRNAGNIICDI